MWNANPDSSTSEWPRIWRRLHKPWMRQRLRPRRAGLLHAGCARWLRKWPATRMLQKLLVDVEGLERTLTVLEEKLFAALTAAAPEDLLVGLKEHAARELAPYRNRMGVVQLRQVEKQFERKHLLVHYNLPRLSLFYMSQQ